MGLIIKDGSILIKDGSLAGDGCCCCDVSCLIRGGGTCELAEPGVSPCRGPATSGCLTLASPYEWIGSRIIIDGWYDPDAVSLIDSWNEGYPDSSLTDCVFWSEDHTRTTGDDLCSAYTFACCRRDRILLRLWKYDCASESVVEITGTAVNEFKPDAFADQNYEYIDFGLWEKCSFFGLIPGSGCECCDAPVQDVEDLCDWPVALYCPP